MNKSKRQKVIMEKIEELKVYSLTDAISLIQSFPKLKFNESIDISVNLGVDPKKSDQNVRGSSSLPHGIGKVSKVAVFAEGAEAADATKAGADIVTLPPKAFEKMYKHRLTDQGLEQFDKDWKELNK